MTTHQVDATIPVTMFTTDADGALTDADTAPVLTIEGPGSTLTPALTHAGTGEYTATFVPDQAGRWVGTCTATVDSIVYVTQARWVVHDGASELAGEGFPAGLQSWEPAV